MQSKLVGLTAALPIAVSLAVSSGSALAASPMPTASSSGLYGSPGTNPGLYGQTSANQEPSGTTSSNPGLYGPPSANQGLYGEPVDNPGLYGSPGDNPGLYGPTESPQGFGGGSAADTSSPTTSPDNSTQTPLPDTGAASTIGSVIGVSAIAFASFMYIRSRRAINGPVRKDGQIIA